MPTGLVRWALTRRKVRFFSEIKLMCRHIYTESIEKSYYDHNLQCRAEKRVRTCILCGKTEKETIYVKDPPKRKLPKFIHDDLSNA